MMQLTDTLSQSQMTPPITSVEQAMRDQMNLIQSLDNAIGRLTDYAQFMLVPEPQGTTVKGSSPQAVAPVASPAVDAVRNANDNIRLLTERVEAFHQRLVG